MDPKRYQDAVDAFLIGAFQFLAEAAGQVFLIGRSIWDAMPADWPPPLKAVLMLAAVLVGLRLTGMTVAAARRLIGWPVRQAAVWLLTLRSPFGKSDWAGLPDLRRAGMTNPGGLFLGQWRGWFRRADLFRHGEGHLLTIAGSGAGKTTALVVPALVGLRTGAVIVTDPKAQLAAMTARHRATKGEVFYLNPFAHDLTEQTGAALPDSGFNPISVLAKGYNLKDDAENLARLLMVTDRRDSGSYWNDEAAGLLAALMVWQVLKEPPENRTLSFLWEMVRESRPAMAQRLEWMAGAKESLFLRAEAEKFLSLIEVAPQWQGVASKAQIATQRYAPETPLGDHTARNGLDLSRLKREDITIYLMIPTGRIRIAAPWLNMLMGVFGLVVGRPGPARPVFMLMDEAPALGYLPDLRNHLRESREAGLRAWIFSQTRAALANPDLYGDNGFEDLMGLCETRSFFSIGERRLAQEISEMLGERTAANRSRGDVGGGEKENLSVVGVPLMRDEEILRMGKGRQLIVRSGMRPIQAQLVPYWTRPDMAAAVDRNPYRTGSE